MCKAVIDMFEACYVQVNIHITHCICSLLTVTEILHYTSCLLLFTFVVVVVVVYIVVVLWQPSRGS